MDRASVETWVTGYERAWRSPGVELLSQLFSADISYRPSPWAEPVVGLGQLAMLWERERSGPDERFDMSSEVVAVDGNTAVVRLSVGYLDEPAQWRDLWVLQFAPDGRCMRFEEWPFAPDQPDGHSATRQ